MDLLEYVSYLQLLERSQHRDDEKAYITSFGLSSCGISLDQKCIQIQSYLLNMSDNYFQQCFRLPKLLVFRFIREMRRRTFNDSDPCSACSQVPFDLRMLATISFLVHGHLELVMPLELFCGISRAKLMRCVASECKRIVYFLTPSLVRFPYKSHDIGLIKNSFLLQFGLPGVVGVLDSFCVNIKHVREEERAKYKNVCGHTSVKVQVICDQMYRFFDVNPRFPGASKDMYVWNRSHIRPLMQNLYAKDALTWLIADRGYCLDSFIINPYRNAMTAEQKRFNGILKNISGVLDKAIALLKARFCCLNGVLPFNHSNSCNIITACVTLHNYIIVNGYLIEDISYSIPLKHELKNAKHEDISPEGNTNREFITKFLRNEQFRNIYTKVNSSIELPCDEAII